MSVQVLSGNLNACSICLDVMEESEDLFTASCLHVFHRECLDPWKRKEGTCPICRTRIQPVVRSRTTAVMLAAAVALAALLEPEDATRAAGLLTRRARRAVGRARIAEEENSSGRLISRL